MCRGWRFREPEVPGAIAPVPATPDMTQEVGIRNCRLYTKPGDAVVSEFEARLDAVEDLAADNAGDIDSLESAVNGKVGYSDLTFNVENPMSVQTLENIQYQGTTYIPSGGGGGSSVGYWGGRTTEEPDTDSNYTFASMAVEVTDGSGKINVSNGHITVGSGVQVIAIDACAGIASVAGNKNIGFSIYKNGSYFWGVDTTSGYSGNIYSESIQIPLVLMPVAQNDVITFKISGANGKYTTVKTTILILK